MTDPYAETDDWPTVPATRPHSDAQPVSAPEPSGSTPEAEEGAREARYAEVIDDLTLPGFRPLDGDWLDDVTRAVMAVADQETADLRAEVVRVNDRFAKARNVNTELRAEVEQRDRALTALDRLLGEARDRAEVAEAESARLASEQRELAAQVAGLRSVAAKVEALAEEWEREADRYDTYSTGSSISAELEQIAKNLRSDATALRAAIASVGVSGSADDRQASPSQAPDTATPGEAAQTETDWQSLLSMVWTGDTTYPFMEDENANITGYGHQDKAAFASAINAYDEDCNGGPTPEDDQWSPDSIAHQWVLPDADDERLHPVAEGTPDAIPVTTLWGAR